jgi:hypothetical protein
LLGFHASAQPVDTEHGPMRVLVRAEGRHRLERGAQTLPGSLVALRNVA